MRLSSMARQRALTLLALTSLVAIMVTITRYSSSYGEPTAIRLMISQQKLIEYQHKLRLVASENNSNQTFNNLLETLFQPKSEPEVAKDKPALRPMPDLSDLSDKAKVVRQSKSSQTSNMIDSDVPIGQRGSAVIEPVPLKIDTRSDHIRADIDPIGSDIGAKVSVNSPNMSQNNPKLSDIKLSIIEPKPLTDQKTPSTDRPPVIKSASKLMPSSSTAKTVIQSKVDIGIDADQKSVQGNQKLQQLDSIENSVDTKQREQDKVKLKPKLWFDANDLKMTDSMKIDKPLGCDDDLGASLDLLVIVNSAVDHFEARRAVRETWGRFAVERGAYLFFLIGSTTDQGVQDRVLLEEQENQDLLQGQFIDNYFNLTLKTISMMKWVSDHCYKVKYLLKVDDDMFVNMQHITDFTETRYFNKCVIGKLAKKWKPHRDPRNKWYVPAEAFNGTLFPSFATGPAYMVSGDAVRPLYQWSVKLRPIYLEDVYMTGIVAERAHIRRLNHAMMTNVHIKNINSCNYSKFMTSHKHSPQEIELLWHQVYAQPPKACSPPIVRPTKTSKPAVNSVKSVTPTKKAPVNTG